MISSSVQLFASWRNLDLGGFLKGQTKTSKGSQLEAAYVYALMIFSVLTSLIQNTAVQLWRKGQRCGEGIVDDISQDRP